MKIYIKTFGCKVNQYNSQLIRKNLLLNSGIITFEIEEADTIIFNSCVVTEKAEKDMLKDLKKAKRQSKDIFVIGCINDSLEGELKALNIPYLREKIFKPSKIISKILSIDTRNLIITDILSDFSGRTRAFVKIQSGCNQFCSYCIIPYVRGTLECRNKEEIIDEIREILNRGYKEVVLTGTQIGLYNYKGERLSDLIEEIIGTFPELKRLRISSIDPTLIDSKLIKLMKIKDSPLCNHLHIPLQSGSDRILKLMNRKYNIDYFLSLIGTLRENILDINITTDVIVGFPDESEEDFKKTIKAVELAKFSKVHIFPYSDRLETSSFDMGEKVSEPTKKQRVKELLELSERISYNVRNLYVGKEVSVLLEKKGKGFSRNYLKVLVEREKDSNNTGIIVSTDIKSCDEKLLYG